MRRIGSTRLDVLGVRRTVVGAALLALVAAVVAAPAAAAADQSFTGRVDNDAATTSTPKSAVHTINVGAAGTITAKLDWLDPTANLTLLLKNPSGTQVASSATSNNPETLSYDATTTGTYKLNVIAASGAADYTLSASYPTSSGGGTDLATYDTSFGFSGPAKLYAYGMDWDPTDRSLLVGDYWNYRVKRFTESGAGGNVVSVTKPAGQPGGTTAPYDVETDLFDMYGGKSSYWIGDQGSYRIVQFSHDGKWLQSIGFGGSGSDAAHPGGSYPKGCGNGAMTIPTHVYADPVSGILYVSDPSCRAVYMFDHGGQYLGQFDWAPWKAATKLTTPIPRGLAAGPDGLIYVVEFNGRSVVVFDKAGKYVRKFERQADMNDPRGLDIDQTSGNVVVVAGYFNEVFTFTSAGTFLRKWGTVNGVDGGAKFDAIRFPAVDDAGNIYVGETWGTRQPDGTYTGYGVYKYTAEGKRLAWATGAGGPPDGGYNQQNGIALDGNGGLHVIDTFEQRAQRLNTASSCLSAANCPAWELQYGSREPAGTQSKGFGYPRALTYGKERNLIYVGDNNNAVLAWTRDGQFVHRFGSQGKSLPTQFSGGVQGIRVQGGKIYTTDIGNCRLNIWDEDQSLVAGNTTGTLLTTMGSCGTGTNQMSTARGIAVGDANGDPNTVFVAETGTSRVSRWNVSTKTSTQLRPSCAGVGLKTPWGITWDPARTWLYIGDVGNARIVRMKPDGTDCQVVTTGAGTPEGKLKGVNFIEFDHQGRMYASDNNRRVYRFKVTG